MINTMFTLFLYSLSFSVSIYDSLAHFQAFNSRRLSNSKGNLPWNDESIKLIAKIKTVKRLRKRLRSISPNWKAEGSRKIGGGWISLDMSWMKRLPIKIESRFQSFQSSRSQSTQALCAHFVYVCKYWHCPFKIIFGMSERALEKYLYMDYR